MKFLLALVLILLIIGGVNLGLQGLAGFNLIHAVIGTADAWVGKIIYIVIGVAAIIALVFFRKYI